MTITAENIFELYDHYQKTIQTGINLINLDNIANAELATITVTEIINGRIHDQIGQLIEFFKNGLSFEVQEELQQTIHEYGNGRIERYDDGHINYVLDGPHPEEFDITVAIRMLHTFDNNFLIAARGITNWMATIIEAYPAFEPLEPHVANDYTNMLLNELNPSLVAAEEHIEHIILSTETFETPADPFAIPPELMGNSEVPNWFRVALPFAGG